MRPCGSSSGTATSSAAPARTSTPACSPASGAGRSRRHRALPGAATRALRPRLCATSCAPTSAASCRCSSSTATRDTRCERVQDCTRDELDAGSRRTPRPFARSCPPTSSSRTTSCSEARSGPRSGAPFAVKAHGSELEYSMRGNPSSRPGGRTPARRRGRRSSARSTSARSSTRCAATSANVIEVPPGVDIDEWRSGAADDRARGAARGGAARRAEPRQRRGAAPRRGQRRAARRVPRTATGPLSSTSASCIEQKGVHVLVDALAGIAARLVVVGFGPSARRSSGGRRTRGRGALHRPARAPPPRAPARARRRLRRPVHLPRGVRDGRGRGGRGGLPAARRAPLGPRRGRGRASRRRTRLRFATWSPSTAGRRGRSPRAARGAAGARSRPIAARSAPRRARPSSSAGAGRASRAACSEPFALTGCRCRQCRFDYAFPRHGRRAARSDRPASPRRARALRRRQRLHRRRRGGVRAPRPDVARPDQPVRGRPGRRSRHGRRTPSRRRAHRVRGRDQDGADRELRRRARRRSPSAAPSSSALVEPLGLTLGATGTHPWANWKDQRIIDTPHYRRNDQLLRYVVWKNNTFGFHVHVGIQGADRALHVATRCATGCPSCSRSRRARRSPRASKPGSIRPAPRSSRGSSRAAASPTRSPPGPTTSATSGSSTTRGSIDEHTQLWWSVRPHLAFPTVEIRICDGQPDLAESQSLAALCVALVARIARALDEGEPIAIQPHRLIEENMWRAIRYGLSGELIDLERGDVLPARARLERLLEWVRPVAARDRRRRLAAAPGAERGRAPDRALRRGRRPRRDLRRPHRAAPRRLTSRETCRTAACSAGSAGACAT